MTVAASAGVHCYRQYTPGCIPDGFLLMLGGTSCIGTFFDNTMRLLRKTPKYHAFDVPPSTDVHRAYGCDHMPWSYAVA